MDLFFGRRFRTDYPITRARGRWWSSEILATPQKNYSDISAAAIPVAWELSSQNHRPHELAAGFRIEQNEP
jgi:hypothetical protein